MVRHRSSLIEVTDQSETEGVSLLFSIVHRQARKMSLSRRQTITGPNIDMAILRARHSNGPLSGQQTELGLEPTGIKEAFKTSLRSSSILMQ